MEKIIDTTLYETVRHGTRDLPFVIYKNEFKKGGNEYILSHWHNEIEIAYCPSSSIIYTINDKTFILNQNNMVIVNSNTIHQAEINDENVTWYAILFDPKFIYGFDESKIKEEIFEKIDYNNLFLTNTNIIDMLNNLIDLYYKDIDFKSLRLQNALSTLYLHILSEAKNNNEVQLTNASNQSVRLKQILDYISLHYLEKITIDDISKNVGICRSEVCKLFKLELNTSIADYILKYRIEKSIPLLLSDKINISEIAERSGFNSSSYYAEAFKKVKGLTPKEYKQNNKKKE